MPSNTTKADESARCEKTLPKLPNTPAYLYCSSNKMIHVPNQQQAFEHMCCLFSRNTFCAQLTMIEEGREHKQIKTVYSTPRTPTFPSKAEISGYLCFRLALPEDAVVILQGLKAPASGLVRGSLGLDSDSRAGNGNRRRLVWTNKRQRYDYRPRCVRPRIITAPACFDFQLLSPRTQHYCSSLSDYLEDC